MGFLKIRRKSARNNAPRKAPEKVGTSKKLLRAQRNWEKKHQGDQSQVVTAE
ncbi:MAG: hypothetical protein RLY57_194 [Candidatus Parcubacteria bacterium]|jgi:hypothetical protein